LNQGECVQFDSLPRPPLILEVIRAYGWIPAAGIPLWIFIAFVQGSMGITYFCIWFPVFAAVAIVSWFKCRRFRQALKRIPENAIADRNAVYRRPTPWKQITDFNVERVTDERQRIWIHRARAFSDEYPVDAEIQCTSEQANELWQWVAGRIANARIIAGKSK
jgi:hypothetical protein